ncbi:MAG: CDP-diacylglycerol--glycerol-3-phosphate 3-phosphatidyltransferase [Treponema sp.]|uniref:CDP-diacylglycerol--glycerol-3-phosphate 3-phosphatidyltransferase n=1 Tax=Treponema sp. TaxID=166 RepID=UPI001B6E0387|nr:CDP-diacylglycerol--glycerol-3-phosphate 3-phosphatidyltransferase [Treponema sp.]MBP5402205.1 CDP-diacylglycerol--glycerol-3-phosphate 3-phosphatidyltransferase [Treponema sp.]MBR5933030.1 CDP-diacylglycerol--glycerol-3-phosphate 3-phosphatidyltransferase [Treponema sp.]
MKLSDKFTFTRIILSPVFLALYIIPFFFPTLTEFKTFTGWFLIPFLGFMEFTDFLDGFFARRQNEVSDFGKIFDPFADVIVHITTLSCFAFTHYFNPVCLILILYREFTMNFLRMIALKKNVAIAARSGGKIKTCLYILTGFVMLFVECAERIHCPIEGSALKAFTTAITVLSWLCVGAAYISFIDYIRNFKSVFKD